MDELYKLMDQMLDTDYKLECIKNMLNLPYDKMPDISMSSLLSVITVIGDCVSRTANIHKAAVSALDSYIAANASKSRSTRE